MQPMNRVQGNIVNRQERRFLDWACSMMPDAVTSDHLTLFGVLGAVFVLVGYVASHAGPIWLWLSVLGYVMHWFGDSMDGSLARFRKAARPRYGYFLDHSVDAFCILLMVGGMGLTPCVRLDVALFMVIGYFALSIHVFLKNHVTGTFQLSFMALGPTELRMLFIALTLWMAACGAGHGVFAGSGLSDYDIALLVTGGVFVSLFMIHTVAMIVKLRAIEGDGSRRDVLVPPVVDAVRRAAPRAPIVDPADHLRPVASTPIY